MTPTVVPPRPCRSRTRHHRAHGATRCQFRRGGGCRRTLSQRLSDDDSAGAQGGADAREDRLRPAAAGPRGPRQGPPDGLLALGLAPWPRPFPASPVLRTQTRLLTIAKPHPAASIVDLTKRRQFELPIGTDNEDLVCGTCGMVVLSGWSASSTGRQLVVDAQLLIRCGTCRTYNVVPAARLAEERRSALSLVDNRLRSLYMRARNGGQSAMPPQRGGSGFPIRYWISRILRRWL